MEHEFTIVPDVSTKEDWSLQAAAYAPFFCGQKDNESKWKIKQTLHNSLRVHFEKWVLPGAGYVIILKQLV